MSVNTFDDRKKLHRLIDGMASSCDRKLTDEAADEYFRHLSHYSPDTVGLAIDNLVSMATPGKDGFHSIPMVGEIINEIKRMRAEKAMSVIPEWCSICNNSGIVLVEYKDRQPVAYRCSCLNGSRHDKGIKPWSDVKDRLGVPEDVFPVKLPITSLAGIEAMGPNDAFENGVEVGKICETCKQPYSFRHDRRMTKQDLKEFHARPAECEPCYVERGKRHGLWT